jgi:hypothetical protein
MRRRPSTFTLTVGDARMKGPSPNVDETTASTRESHVCDGGVVWSQPAGRPSVGLVGRPQDHATAQSRPTERASTALRVTSGSHADRGAGQLASMPGQSTVYESEPADC